ncbi:MAG: hypothetical protein JWQ40_3488 [Segetibacter sp.]|jgi:NAD dependent epimerase/dehydratase family enzyme|nr:hypothetical protein [Segetibacter sp.]
MKNKKIVIAGGTGFMRQHIASYFGAGNNVVILSRKQKHAANNAFKSFTSVS